MCEIQSWSRKLQRNGVAAWFSAGGMKQAVPVTSRVVPASAQGRGLVAQSLEWDMFLLSTAPPGFMPFPYFSSYLEPLQSTPSLGPRQLQFEATVQLPCSRRELGGYSLIMLLYLGIGSSAFPTRMCTEAIEMFGCVVVFGVILWLGHL